GRGVGLDAVLRDVRRLGGGLLVTSEPGRGSVFTLRLPITLAVLHVLLVERAGQTFGIAVGAIREALQDEPALRHGGRQAVRFRDEAVPLADLGTLLGAGGAEATDDGPILVLEVLGRRVAVRCDRLVGEEEVVVKPLGPLLGRLPSYLGATILDDGRLALIVDVRHVVQVAATAAAAPPRRPDDAPSRATRLLVVDDQVTVRELQRTILGAAGYEVVTARDGREALELLDRAAVDLVLTDVEMPGMDGFALIEALRADPDHTSLPVIVLSSRGDEVDRRRGAEAGADAYVVKSEFDQRALLETVRRLVIR
ncbi:MAG TPA: response regulator, partial [Capillimicrobium sp.]